MKRILLSLLLLVVGISAINAVTFNVSVPAGTRSCYIAGDFNGWDAGNAVAMKPSGNNTFTLTLDDVTEAAAAVGYKYLCGQDWAYVEKGASGEEIGNRTTVTVMDVVASWAKMYNPDIIETKLTVNGYPRIVKILLPSDYVATTTAYPVVYLTGVQSRYDNAGSDSDRGDDHMGDMSWNIPGIVNEVASGVPCIFVSMYGFVAENIPYAYPDFEGSGQADNLIEGIANTLMPYINSTYRTLTGAANTSIAGADMGGLFSIYAALKRPDLFGQCASLSPMLWINKEDIMNYASTAASTSSQRFYFSVGELETDVIKNDVNELQAAIAERTNTDVRLTTFAGATHNDVAWGEAFKSIYPYLLSTDASYVGSRAVVSHRSQAADNLAETDYSIVSAIDSQNLVYDSNTSFTYVDNFVSGNSEVEAQVAIVEIPVDVKTQYYWNVSRSADGSGELLKSTNGNIGFSSKKTATTWHRVVVFADESVKDIAAGSHAFRVATATGDVTMTAGNNYTASATVSFGDDKNFEIYFGSVNSGSKQSALTEVLSVPATCDKADILYDFRTNRVTIIPVDGGGNDDDDDDETIDIAATDYSIVSAVDSQELQYDAQSQFTYITDFVSSGRQVPAKVVVTEIPADIKTQYYWNVSRSADGTGKLLKESPGNIGFSSKKTTTSWHRVAILSDETVKDVAANSAAFRVATASESITMSVTGKYTVKASASFAGADKSFTIHYGSVNSGSDMGAITDTHNVSATCTAADISYDFMTNQVSVTETAWGEVIADVVVEKFRVVPAICNVGTTATVSLACADAANIEPSVSVSHNYGAEQSHSLTATESGEWRLDLPNLQAGIYHISLHFHRGETTLSDVYTIAVKVLNDENRNLSVDNPYEGIDWSTIHQYKANFHTHTTQSFDSQLKVDDAVDHYYRAGYKVLALTEHDANPYPWEMFNLFNPMAEARYPQQLDMLAIPGNELSKSYNNSWNEVGGSEFNHHNDFFTGRQGMEFATLRESYAYTSQLGGMQLINHPGQYWNLSTKYTPGEKNSPEWHAENFMTYPSLIGLEVYNQGNRRPNDRILWDQILEITSPFPVWGYSCDDSHNVDQLFSNYNWMLMPELTIDALKTAMRHGTHYFSYEYTGSGEAKAPRISDISINDGLISIATDATEVFWISSTDTSDANNPSTCKSTIVAVGKQFDCKGFQGKYVRALLKNEFGETCTQPFFFDEVTDGVIDEIAGTHNNVTLYPNPATDVVTIETASEIRSIVLYNIMGQVVKNVASATGSTVTLPIANLPQGHYIVSVTTQHRTYNEKLVIK